MSDRVSPYLELPMRSEAEVRAAVEHSRRQHAEYLTRLENRTHNEPFPRDGEVFTSADFERSIRQ